MEEVAYRTPNGLHDAYLLKLSVDYRERILRLELNWWIGTLEGKTEEEREGYQEAPLIVRGLEYLVIEAPAGSGRYSGYAEPSYVDGFVTRPEDILRMNLPTIPEAGFRYSIFVGEWNSFIHFAGHSAEIPDNLIVREMRA